MVPSRDADRVIPLPPSPRGGGTVASRSRGKAKSKACVLGGDGVIPDRGGSRGERREWDRLHPNVRERVVLPCVGAFTVAHRAGRCSCQQ